MRFCNSCKKLTTGKPLFCQHCQSTFDLKLCPHRHENPRSATYCSQCGSSDLSTPQPRPPLIIRLIFLLLPILPGLLLILLSLLAVVGAAQAILTNQELAGRFVCAVLMLALLWFCYLQLADSFAGKAVRKLIGRKRKDRHGNGGGGHGH